MKLKILVLFSLILALFSCTQNIKPTRPSRAPSIRVLLGRISQKDSLTFKGAFRLRLEEAVYELGKHNPFFYLSPAGTGFKMYNPNRLFVFNTNDVVKISPVAENVSRFKFRNKWYKGKIILQVASDGAILLVNKVDLEEYLKSVVPGEMPSSKNGYQEALKAQAICARTYALNQMASRRGNDFDVYADFRDQVYGGLSQQSRLASQAVDATRGVVLEYNDSLAQVYFHSTCGGITESAGNVWGARRQHSYLPVQKDVLGDHFTCQTSPFFRWTRRFTFQQLDSLFRVKLHHPIIPNTVQDTLRLTCHVSIDQRTSSGRVASLSIACPDTTVVLRTYAIRHFFSTAGKGDLPSLLFTLKTPTDSVLVIRGGGYGHGVGMCQWGALNMSLQGFKYYDILVNQYFPGTYLKRIY